MNSVENSSGDSQRDGVLIPACVNAFLWAIGNGMTSTMLIVYLSLEFGAEGLAISLIIAAPKIIGVLRVAAPATNRWFVDRQSSSVWLYCLSGALLLAMSFLTAPGMFASPNFSLALLVICWSAYHLFEYFATVSLWSWLNDMMPSTDRGAFLGVRETCLTAGRIIGGLTAAAISAVILSAPNWMGDSVWRELLVEQGRWAGYALPAGMGAMFMIAAGLSLMWLPADTQKKTQPAFTVFEMFAPLFDRRYLPLLGFSLSFAVANGLTQAPQGMYPRVVLAIPVFWMILAPVFMRSFQAMLATPTGMLIDRWGHRRVLIASQILVAGGPLFFILATPEQPAWIAGAYVLWIAYVGLNVGLPSAMLGLAPERSGPHISVYFAISGLVYGLSTVCGGLLFDWVSTPDLRQWLSQWNTDRFEIFFAVGVLLRLSATIWLFWLADPERKKID